MRSRIILLLTLVFVFKTNAQETIIFDNQSTVITTGVPFLLIASDARGAGMGDMGVATSVDGFSQQWNSEFVEICIFNFKTRIRYKLHTIFKQIGKRYLFRKYHLF